MDLRNRIRNHKSLIESFLSLSILNGLNLLLPLLTLPYILRIIGPANYGIYSFIYVIVQYILLVSAYGFNLSATKQIAQHRNNRKKINEIFNAVIYARISIALIASVIIFFIIYLLLTPYDLIIYLFGLGIVFGDILIPAWLFQGLERMRYLTLVNVASKIVFTILIFFIITRPDDYIYLILFNSLGYLVAGILSTLIALKQFNIRFSTPSVRNIRYQLIDGFHIFCSTISMNLYRNSNIFILGIFANDVIVGIYSAAEKVIKALQGVVSPLAEAFFPHLGYRFKQGTIKENIALLFRISRPFFIALFVLAITVCTLAPFISDLLLGPSFKESIPLIRLMSLVIVLGGSNYVLGIVGLINLDKQKSFFTNVVIAGGVSVGAMLLLVQWFPLYSGGISMVVSELILFVLCIRVLYLNYKVQ